VAHAPQRGKRAVHHTKVGDCRDSLFRRHLHDRREHICRGIVDPDVDRAKDILQRRGRRLHPIRARDIYLIDRCLTTYRLDLLARRLQTFAAAGEETDSRTAPRKRNCRCAADACRRAGDHHDLALPHRNLQCDRLQLSSHGRSKERVSGGAHYFVSVTTCREITE
jgi:hypothetical protein